MDMCVSAAYTFMYIQLYMYCVVLCCNLTSELLQVITFIAHCLLTQPQVYPGDCWAFEGDTGYATIEVHTCTIRGVHVHIL